MITRAPNCLASWMAVVPIPDVPPWTSSVSPFCKPPRSNTLCQTVKKVSGSAINHNIDFSESFCRCPQSFLNLFIFANVPRHRERLAYVLITCARVVNRGSGRLQVFDLSANQSHIRSRFS